METPRRASTTPGSRDESTIRLALSKSSDDFPPRKRREFCYSRANIEMSPYKEQPNFLSLYKGKPQVTPTKVQKLLPTTNNVRVPNSTIQSPVVVVKPDEMPERIDYLIRSKHDQDFEKKKDKEMTKKYTYIHKDSPYKEKMSSLRNSAIITTKKLLKSRDMQDLRDRQEFLKDFDLSCTRAYKSEGRCIQNDVFSRRFNSLRVVVLS